MLIVRRHLSLTARDVVSKLAAVVWCVRQGEILVGLRKKGAKKAKKTKGGRGRKVGRNWALFM